MHQSLEYYNGRQIIVTGASGFIGSHLVDRLLDLGARVVGIDNLITGNLNNLKNHYNQDSNKSANPSFQLIIADLNQPYRQYLSEDPKADLIFHFASPASPPKYQDKPIETYLVNSWATHQLLDYLRHHNPSGRFVFASTSEVYGDPLEHPQTEAYWGNVNPNGLRSCYDESKRLGETICGVHQRDFGIDTRIVRIFNTYGPRMDLYDGRIIPNMILSGLQDEPLPIYGQGEQTRSYCFVDDLVEGVLRLGAFNGIGGSTINLGNPEEYSVLETAEIISQIMNGETAKLAHLPLPKDDPKRRRPDITLAKQLIDWEPSTGFQQGLLPTIDYFKNGFEG